MRRCELDRSFTRGVGRNGAAIMISPAAKEIIFTDGSFAGYRRCVEIGDGHRDKSYKPMRVEITGNGLRNLTGFPFVKNRTNDRRDTEFDERNTIIKGNVDLSERNTNPR